MFDIVLAFMLLDATNLSTLERSLVLTDVYYKQGEKNKDLIDQTTEALKKKVRHWSARRRRRE